MHRSPPLRSILMWTISISLRYTRCWKGRGKISEDYMQKIICRRLERLVMSDVTGFEEVEMRGNRIICYHLHNLLPLLLLLLLLPTLSLPISRDTQSPYLTIGLGFFYRRGHLDHSRSTREHIIDYNDRRSGRNRLDHFKCVSQISFSLFSGHPDLRMSVFFLFADRLKRKRWREKKILVFIEIVYERLSEKL